MLKKYPIVFLLIFPNDYIYKNYVIILQQYQSFIVTINKFITPLMNKWNLLHIIVSMHSNRFIRT